MNAQDPTAKALEDIAKELRSDGPRTPFSLAFVKDGCLYSQSSLCKNVDEYTSLIRATRLCLEGLRDSKKRFIEEGGS